MNAAMYWKKRSWQLAGRKSKEVYLGVELTMENMSPGEKSLVGVYHAT